MRAAALVPIGALLLLVALPIIAALADVGAPSLSALMMDAGPHQAALRGLSLAAAGVAIGWPAGLCAAFGIWGCHRVLRLLVIGAGLLLVTLPRSLGMAAAGGHATATLLAAHAAPAAGAALLILTVRLDRLDPWILRSAAASGATAWQAWRLVLWPALGATPFLAVAAGFGLSVL